MTIKQVTQQASESDSKAKGEKAEELETEGPLSEKDEVKQAEENTQKQQNKGR